MKGNYSFVVSQVSLIPLWHVLISQPNIIMDLLFPLYVLCFNPHPYLCHSFSLFIVWLAWKVLVINSIIITETLKPAKVSLSGTFQSGYEGDVKGEEHVYGSSDLSGLMQIRVWPRIAIKFKFGSILITFSTLAHTNNHAKFFWEASWRINRRNKYWEWNAFTLQLWTQLLNKK